MYHPFYDGKNLEDNEVVDRLNKLYLQLGHAERSGQQQMSKSIQVLIDSLMLEQSDRFHKNQEEKLKKDKIDITAPITFG